MKIKKKRGCRELAIITFLLLFLTHASPMMAKTIDIEFPEEQLSSRLKKISKIGEVDILFDLNDVGTTKVAALKAEKISIEEVLSQTLKTTRFTYKKTADTSFAIIEKTSDSVSPQKSKGAGSIKGRIVEAETSEPIIGAIIKVKDTQLAVISDENGYYTLSKVPEGKNTIEVSYMGFKTEQINARIEGNKVTNYDIKMIGESQLLSEVVVSGIRKQRGAVYSDILKQLFSKNDEKILDAVNSISLLSKDSDHDIHDFLLIISQNIRNRNDIELDRFLEAMAVGVKISPCKITKDILFNIEMGLEYLLDEVNISYEDSDAILHNKLIYKKAIAKLVIVLKEFFVNKSEDIPLYLRKWESKLLDRNEFAEIRNIMLDEN